jgi:hypothetical protein
VLAMGGAWARMGGRGRLEGSWKLLDASQGSFANVACRNPRGSLIEVIPPTGPPAVPWSRPPALLCRSSRIALGC